MLHSRAYAVGVAITALILGGCQESISAPGPAAGPAMGWTASAGTSPGSLYGYYLSARVAQAENDIASAARFYGLALEGEPDNVDILKQSLAAFVIDGRIDQAIAVAKTLAKSDSDPGGALLTLAVDDVASGDYQAAQERLAAMPRVGFNALLSPLLEAWAEIGTGDLDAAREKIQALAGNAAFKPIFDYHMGLMSDLVGLDMAAAESYRSAASALDGGSIRVVQAAGAFFERTGRPDEARAMYLKYLASNPDSTAFEDALARLDSGGEVERPVPDAKAGFAEALYGISSALYQESAYDAALTYAQLARYLEPKLDVVLLLIGDIHAASDRDEIAVENYVQVDPRSMVGWPAQIRLAASYERLDRVDEAVARLRDMGAQRPDRVDALVSLGEILRAHERYKEAVEVYDQAIERIGTLEPRHWSVLYARGMSYERIGAWGLAEKDFLTALDLVPEQPFVLNYLGYSWVEQGVNLRKAKNMIERAVAQRPTDGYIVDSLGWVLYQLGDYSEAVKHLERATELRPHDPVIIDHFADALWRAGRTDEARFQWRRALSFGPEDDLSAVIERKVRSGLGELAPAKAMPSTATHSEL
ncbi:MAG: hypothetical protein CMM50_14225 [Rhodospirillaceae bacterium]|nr:hypothetical protein [Rhodospirillaceae bacterium]